MGDWTPPERRFSQIGLRLLTAAILIPAGLFVVWHGGWWLALASGLFGGTMAWEWARMSGHPRGWLLAGAAALCCFALPLGHISLLAAVTAFGMALVFGTTVGGPNARMVGVLGWLYVTAMAAGLWFLREGPWDGRAVALYFMSFVWASDAAAYFVGRGLGGPRLLPQESPNKTWSGAIGALMFTAVCGFAASDLEQANVFLWILLGLSLSFTAQLGDLLESGLKRRFKIKDSSNLLPGHGGVMDRVDGLGAVGILASLLFWLVPAIPMALGLAK